jgi:hypothetical protein
MHASLQQYREKLKGVETIRAELALEIIDAAEAEIEQAHGEYSLAQAVGLSGRSRSWFERRLPQWNKQGLARKVGRVWLIKRAAIPARKRARKGFDPKLEVDAIVQALADEDAA